MKRSKFGWTDVVEMMNEILRTGLVVLEAPTKVVRLRQVTRDDTLAKRLAVFISATSTTGIAPMIDFESWFQMACSVVASKGEAFLYRDDRLWKLFDCNPLEQADPFLVIENKFLFQFCDDSGKRSMKSDVLEKVRGRDGMFMGYLDTRHPRGYDHELVRLHA